MEKPSILFLSDQGQQRPPNPPRFQNKSLSPLLPYEVRPQNLPPSAKENLEELLVKFMGVTDNRMSTIETAQRNQKGSIRNSKKHIRQLVKLVSERTQGALPSNTEVNLREHVNVV